MIREMSGIGQTFEEEDSREIDAERRKADLKNSPLSVLPLHPSPPLSLLSLSLPA
jgi:hypothetical protein